MACNILVRIPTNRKQLQSSSSRLLNKQYSEIKSEECVKSELEGGHTAQAQSYTDSMSIVDDDHNSFRTETLAAPDDHGTTLVTARPKSAVKCFKCTYCPYISIKEENLGSHIQLVHTNSLNGNNTQSEKRLNCPACSNVHFSRPSFRSHLINDHQMNHEESTILLKSCLSTAKKSAKANPTSQKIYLRNVEVLKNIKPATIQTQESNNFPSNAFNTNERCMYANNQLMQHPNENICIDSGDSICCDSLDMSNCNDQQMESDYFRNKLFVRDVNNMNKQNDHIQHSFGNVNGYLIDPSATPNMLQHRNISPQSSNAHGSMPSFDFRYPMDFEKHNVVMSSLADNVYTSHVNERPLVWKEPQNYKHSDSLEPFSHSSVNIDTSLPLQHDIFGHTPYVVSDNDSLSIASTDYDTGCVPNTPSPGVPATTTVTDERKKIFIKNIDILKEPIISTTPAASANIRKSTLHLRTVDEVNLMLINEVHNDAYYNSETICNNQNNCNNSIAVSAYSEYVNDFSETQTNHMTPPAASYFHPQIEISNNPLYDEATDNTENTVIVLDDMGHSLENRSIGKHHDTINSHRTFGGGDTQYYQTGNLLETNDLIIGCEDILDLTTDEVEQIFDDNGLMNNNLFSNAGSSILLAAPKSLDKREAESPENTTAEISNNTVVKRKGGRPKGARKSYYSAEGQRIFTYKCSHENCSIRFALQNTLDFHEKCHTSTTKTGIFCPKCTEKESGDIDFNWNTLHTHLWRQHEIDMELYKCTECSFRTPILSRLNNTHMKIHSNVKEYRCELCEKCFKNTKQLKNHRRIHSGNTVVHRCNYCNKSFFNVRYLKVHINKNHKSIDDSFKCDICQKGFTSDLELKNHRRIHFDDKKFQCPTCKYKSNDHNALRRHQMTHSKEALYKCPVCSFQCIQSTSYKTHIMKKHPDLAKDLIFACNLNHCDFKTVNKKIFEIHQLKHANQQNE